MFFREMEEADLSEILLLDREIFRSMAYSERDFRYAISGKYDRAILLVEKEQIIAYGILRLLGTEGELESIAVRKEYRGRGYGRLLLSEFLRLAKHAGTEKLFLEVREGNQAGIQLYESAGFRTFSRRKAYYRDPVEDALLMERIME